MKTQIASNVVSVCVLAIIAGIFLTFAPRATNDIRGVVLPIQPLKTLAETIDPESVKIYSDDGSAPLLFRPLAKIDLEKHFSGEPNTEEEHSLLTEAKRLTAQLGGNGLVIRSFGHTEGLGNDEMNMYQVQVIAIQSSNAVSRI